MRYKLTKLPVLLFLFLNSLTYLKAQETVNVSGGKISGSDGSVCYSVGQVVYNTNLGTSGSVTQGVQQPYEISVIIGIKQTSEMQANISLFPNPVSDFLKLKTDNFEKENVIWQLFDQHGKLLKNGKLTDNELIIKTDKLVSSTYFLTVTKDKKVLTKFKIIKN